MSKAVLASAVPPYLYSSDDNPDGGLDDATIEQFEDVRRQAIGMALPASPVATLACIRAFGQTDFRDDVASIDVPTLVIHGDSDAVVPFEVSGRRSAEQIAAARLHVVAGGPHTINAGHVEEFNRELIAFLAG